MRWTFHHITALSTSALILSRAAGASRRIAPPLRSINSHALSADMTKLNLNSGPAPGSQAVAMGFRRPYDRGQQPICRLAMERRSGAAVMQPAFATLGDHMAVAADGIDLNAPLAGATAAGLRRALLDHLVLCIRGQTLAPVAYREAMRIFGTLVPQTRTGNLHDEVPEILILSSEDRDKLGDGKPLVVGAHWHSDDSYKAAPCALT